MVYNLAEYIEQNTSLTINVNGFQPDSQDIVLCVNEGSGSERPWFDRQDTIIQILSRARDRTMARKNSFTAYDLLKKKYGLTLPAVTVAGDTFSSLAVWAIRPAGRPQYAYDDDSGRPVYSFSVEITTTQ